MNQLESAAADLVGHPVRPPTPVATLEDRVRVRQRRQRVKRSVAAASALTLLVLGAAVLADRNSGDTSLDTAGLPDATAEPGGDLHGILAVASTWTVVFTDPFADAPADRDPAIRYDLTSLPAMLVHRLELAGIEGAQASLGACCEEMPDPTRVSDGPAEIDVVVNVPPGVDADEVQFLLGSSGQLMAGSVSSRSAADCERSGGPWDRVVSPAITFPAEVSEVPSSGLCLSGNPLNIHQPTTVREDGSLYAPEDSVGDVTITEEAGEWSVTVPLGSSGSYWLGESESTCAAQQNLAPDVSCPALALDDRVYGVGDARIEVTYEVTGEEFDRTALVVIDGLTEREASLLRALLQPDGTWYETVASINAPSEVPPSSDVSVSGEPAYEAPYLNRWNDAEGNPVPLDVLMLRAPGPDFHCAPWPADILMGTPLGSSSESTEARAFVRDIIGGFADPDVVPGFDADTELPPGAIDTGYRREGMALWMDPTDDEHIYVVTPNGVEAWPRSAGNGCA